MKRTHKLVSITIFIFGGFFIKAWGQCPIGVIEFSSQAQVDNFPINFPGCTHLPSSVYISGPDITNLDALSQVTSIGGNLQPYNNPLLTDISGLSNVTGGVVGLDIFNNPLLASLNGLGGITSTGGSLTVVNNPALTSLEGLEGIQSVAGGLAVTNNPSIFNLTGLDGLQSVSGGFSIAANSSLTSLTGLEGLNTTGLTFYIGNNPMLTSLTPLIGLNSIGGPLVVSDCPLITSLSGLDNIAPGSITNLFLSGNSDLSFCEVPSICNYLSVPTNPANISGNTTGCNSRLEVETACGLLPVELIDFKSNIKGQDCLLAWRTASEHDNSHFEIEHSLNAISFEKIGRVEGNGTSVIGNTYEYLHPQIYNGVHYYRLKQFDFDGKFTYSQLATVEMSNGTDMQIYPNPVSGDEIYLKGDFLPETKNFMLIYSNGTLVRSVPIEGNAVNQNINVSDLLPGIYFVEIIGDGGVVFRQKIIKI